MNGPTPIPDWVPQEVGMLYLELAVARRRIADLEAALATAQATVEPAPD